MAGHQPQLLRLQEQVSSCNRLLQENSLLEYWLFERGPDY